MSGSELWWKGDHVLGTVGRADKIQQLFNQEARATTGCFRTTNLGAHLMELGFRPATTQWENRGTGCGALVYDWSACRMEIR